MTGYGKAKYINANKRTTVEIRSLNSKQLDLNLKTAPVFREHEADIRALLSPTLERGKVDVSICQQRTDATGEATDTTNYSPIDHQAFGFYYRELRALEQELGIEQGTIPWGNILRMPDVIKPQTVEQTISDEEWTMLRATLQEALAHYQAFRIQEGQALERMFTEKLDGIAQLLREIEPYEKGRVDKIKQHLLQNLDRLAEETKQRVDQNRLEAELIYYLEKLDVTEEKVRLSNHIRYFRETMAAEGSGVGKKLGFIAQEMGREINTLGSKSNQSEMQIIVVKMKDILEQIKEQVLNVL